jgi:transposase
MKISTIGVDLAKEYFQIHAVDEHGKVVQKKKLKRKEVTAKFCEP